MGIAADRPGTVPGRDAGASAGPSRLTLRIQRGAKVLSEVKIGRSRVVIGGGAGANLRLKNAGLADECLVLDTRTLPFQFESRLGHGELKVNGADRERGDIAIGDRISMAMLTLEIIDPDAALRAPPPPIDVPELSEDAIDPYMGKRTAAKVKQSEIDRARELIAKRDADRNGNGNGNGAVVARAPEPVGSIPPARAAVPAAPAAIPETTPARPPWLELVGDDQVADARIYLFDGITAGRQGEAKIRHPSISKKHAQFSIVGTSLQVTDLGSTNGVWVNRERITSSRVLVEGDVLHLGAVEFRVRVPAQGEVTNFAAPNPEPRTATSLNPRTGRHDQPTSELDHTQQDRRSGGRHRDDPTQGEIPRSPRQDPTQGEAVARSDRDDTEAEIARGRRDESRPLVRGDASPSQRKKKDVDERAATELELPVLGRAAARDVNSTELDLPTQRPDPKDLFQVTEIDPEALRSDAPSIVRDLSKPIARGKIAPRTRVAQPEPDFPAPKRRSALPMFFAASFFVLIAAGGVGGWMAWPQIRERLEAARAQQLTTAPDPAGGTAPSTKKAAPAKKPATMAAKPGAKAVRTVDALPEETPIAEPEPTPDEEAPVSLFEDAPINLKDGQLSGTTLASLERESATRGLRAERTIGAEELKSIYLTQESAVIRSNAYKDDGFYQAPSASDPTEAEARRQGAKQMDSNKVNELIRGKFPAVKNCLVGAGAFKGGKARVVVQFTIQPNGKVENASIVESGIKSGSFNSCVTGVVRGIKFPKPKDQSVVVQFPFVFTYN